MALQTSFPPSSSSCSFSSSSFSYAWKYHVFLSFRGPDTRHDFIGHLHKALSDKGIHTFIDDEELRKGEEITTSLAEAIEESRIAIPVFSENYASSAFCLDELVKIMECVKGKGRLVFPIFYKVDPHNVRHQSGSYGEALTTHEKRFKDDKGKVQRWREALHQAANLSGEHFKPGNEYECDFIEKIVKEISKRISRIPLHVADYPVGLQSRVLEVNRIINDGFEGGVHMVGIYGSGGIGKTTLAKVVYNSVADQFEGLCFIENMSELSVKHGLPYLQKMLLSKILGEKICDLGSVSELIPIINERLRCKKVLLVLDNVDKHEQLQAIIGRPDWLGSGSRVIITTRNKRLLTIHEVEKLYEVRVLNEKEALELFTWMAFKSKNVELCYMDILTKLVTYASGLPLALEVIGSSLFGRCVEEWRSALDEYRKIPDGDVQRKLIVSFDALHPHEKSIFLDIACCFKGYELREVVDVLHAHYGIDPTYRIRMLIDKSLIKIDTLYVTLHDLIQDMGREIVRLESPNELGARSRLWLADEIIEVLQGDKGSSKIQVINLEFDYNADVIEWDGLAFKKMENLRTLIIGKHQFSQCPKYLPSSLRVLKWELHSLGELLPFSFDPKQLVIFDLSRNCFDSVQMAELLKKKFENMRVLKFDFCKHVTKIPKLSSAPKLEELSFTFCGKLTEIDESVGTLDKLKTLNAFGCSQLRSLPPVLLPSLKQLELSGCSSLESFPEILGKMESMTYLFLGSVPIKKLPSSIHNLTGLQSLLLWGGGIVELPSSITLLEVKFLCFSSCKGLLLPNQDEGEEQGSSMAPSHTRYLEIKDCNISEEFLRIAFPMFPHLQSLCLGMENFRILPECIEESQFLRKLHLFDCKKLEEIRGIPPNIEELIVVGCTSLSLLTRKCIEGFKFLRKLHLFDCKKLEEIRGIPPNIEELWVKNCRSLSSLTREMLLNKKLYEEGQDKTFIFPGERLPVWFEYQRWKSPITFWLRNKFPAISFGVLKPKLYFSGGFARATLTINGRKSFHLVEYSPNKIPDGHIFIFNKTQTTFRDQVDEALSENEWNRAVFFVGDDVAVGVHIIKERSSMDDIRFTDPLLQKECDTLRDMGYPHETLTQFVQQSLQQTNSGSLEWQVVHGTDLLSLGPPPLSAFYDNVSWDSNSEQMSSTTTPTLNFQGCGTSSTKRKRVTQMPALNYDLTGQSNYVKIEPFEEMIEDSFDEAEEQSSIRKRKASSSSAKTPTKIQKTTTEQNHEKDSDVEVLETTIVPTSISEANHGSYESFIQAENAPQPLNSLIEIQPPSPQPLDPLAELERVLQGSYDVSPESTSPTAACCPEIQSSEVFIILQNLKPSLDNPLEMLIAEGEIKLQIMDCLSKLVQLEDHIPISLQSIVAQVRDFYEDLICSFPSIQQTLVDYSCLEETRSKFLENLKQAKVKQTQIEVKVSQEKNQLEELAAEIADLELKLKAAVKKQNELQLAIKNGEAGKNKILEDASAWLMESKQVVKKMRSSEHAYRDAQNSKARLEGRLAKLKEAFAANKP